MVHVATETDGRVRLAHALTNDEETIKPFADANVSPDATVTTDGHAAYNVASLGAREHTPHVQTKAERQDNDRLQTIHWVMSQLKRWLLGTHGDAVKPKHLQAYLDEFAFRWNRRKTKGVARVAARTFETLVSHGPLTMRAIVRGAVPYPLFTPQNLGLPE
jgi:transposase-like protein